MVIHELSESFGKKGDSNTHSEGARLADFPIGIAPNQRRMFYEVFNDTIELNSKVMSDHISEIRWGYTKQHVSSFTKFVSKFEEMSFNWKHTLENPDDLSFAEWLKLETMCRQLAKFELDTQAGESAVLQMLDQFLKAAQDIVDENDRAREAAQDRRHGEDNTTSHTKPIARSGAMQELDKLAERASRIA